MNVKCGDICNITREQSNKTTETATSATANTKWKTTSTASVPTRQ